MVANILMGFKTLPGREGEGLGVLGDFAAYFEGFGAQATAYRALYAGELTNRINFLAVTQDTAARAVLIDKLIADGANSPLVKGMNSTTPPLAITGRVLSRSIEPDLPMLPQSPVRVFRGFVAAPGRRGEVEQALRDARVRHEGLGVRAGGFVVEEGGPVTGHYTYLGAHDSLAAYEEFGRKNAALSAPPPLVAAMDGGAMTLSGGRVDIRIDFR